MSTLHTTPKSTRLSSTPAGLLVFLATAFLSAITPGVTNAAVASAQATTSAAATQSIVFSSQQITCMSCAGKVKKALKKSPAVKSVSINEDTMKVTVVLKKGQTHTDQDLRDLMVPTNFSVDTIERM